jgi:hypothetical protein
MEFMTAWVAKKYLIPVQYPSVLKTQSRSVESIVMDL